MSPAPRRAWTADEIHRVLTSADLAETARQIRRPHASCRDARRRYKGRRGSLSASHYVPAAHSPDLGREISIHARRLEPASPRYPCRRCGIDVYPGDADVVPEWCRDCDDPEFRLAEYGKGPFRIQPSDALRSSELQAA